MEISLNNIKEIYNYFCGLYSYKEIISVLEYYNGDDLDELSDILRQNYNHIKFIRSLKK